MQASVSGALATAFLTTLLLVPGGPAAAQISRERLTVTVTVSE